MRGLMKSGSRENVSGQRARGKGSRLGISVSLFAGILLSSHLSSEARKLLPQVNRDGTSHVNCFREEGVRASCFSFLRLLHLNILYTKVP